ncbi:hypothetical protein E5D57_009398 [Metarhizium anisopliae]|nr:hypothetical protein E5D57_009398 [Metarhizium anisopliae]
MQYLSASWTRRKRNVDLGPDRSLHPSPFIPIHMGSNVHGHVHARVHGSHPPTMRSISDQGAWIGSHIPMCCILYSSPAGSLVAQRRHGRQAIS